MKKVVKRNGTSIPVEIRMITVSMQGDKNDPQTVFSVMKDTVNKVREDRKYVISRAGKINLAKK